MIKIVRASSGHLEDLAPLFNAYRIFYGQASDVEASLLFLKERIEKEQSVVLMAKIEESFVGFTQLFTTYSSVSLQPYYILNDLYVKPKFRGQRIGSRLLDAAKQLCCDMDFKGLALETAVDNPAQELYERLGWLKDTEYFHYFWKNHK